MQDVDAKMPAATGDRRAVRQPKPGAMRRGEVQDQVFAAVCRGLVGGAFVPGQVVSLRKLAAHFGTSAMPVRKALAQLIAANVLEALPNRTVRVPRLSEGRLKELTEVRVSIEGMATRMACAHMDGQRLRRLHDINDELTAAIARRDIAACLATNQAFHFTLYEGARSEVLMPLIEPLWLQCGPTMFYSLLAPDMPWDASAHGALLKALEQGDAPAAQRAIARDIRTTLRNIRKRSAKAATIPPVSSMSELTVEPGMLPAMPLPVGNGRGR